MSLSGSGYESRRSQVRVLQSVPVTPLIVVCAKLRLTIHCPGTKTSIGRGLELLPEDGCLRDRASQWRNWLRDFEEEDKTFRKETDY